MSQNNQHNFKKSVNCFVSLYYISILVFKFFNSSTSDEIWHKREPSKNWNLFSNHKRSDSRARYILVELMIIHVNDFVSSLSYLSLSLYFTTDYDCNLETDLDPRRNTDFCSDYPETEKFFFFQLEGFLTIRVIQSITRKLSYLKCFHYFYSTPSSSCFSSLSRGILNSFSIANLKNFHLLGGTISKDFLGLFILLF